MIAAYRRWAFAPVDTAPMAALRIACGLLALGWALSFLPDVDAFLADNGLTSGPTGGSTGWWSIGLGSPYGVLVLLMLSAIAMVLGWHTRIASVLVFLLLLVIQRRDVFVLNSGDLLLRELAFYVALMPAGQCWSLDARRRGFVHERAPWGLQLLRLQVSMLYLFSVVAKLHGTSWQDGSAVGKAVQLVDLQRFVVPHAIATSVTASALLTYGTLVVEAALVVGLWTRFRYYVMAAGVAIHLGIEGTLLIGWFSLTVISCYLTFVPAEDLRRVVAAGRRRLTRASSADRSTSLPASTSA